MTFEGWWRNEFRCPIRGWQASLVAHMVKKLPEMWEMWVWSLGWEDPLEKKMATHSSILTQPTPVFLLNSLQYFEGSSQNVLNILPCLLRWMLAINWYAWHRVGRVVLKKRVVRMRWLGLVLLLSHFSRVKLCVTPSLGFSRQEHWSGLPFPSPIHKSEKWKWSRSLMSDSSRPHGLQPTRLLCPWDFPGESTGVGCHSYLENYSSLDRGAWQASPRGCKESAMTEWSAFSLSKTIVFTVNFA